MSPTGTHQDLSNDTTFSHIKSRVPVPLMHGFMSLKWYSFKLYCRGGEESLLSPGEAEGQGHQHCGGGLPDSGAQEAAPHPTALLPPGKGPVYHEIDCLWIFFYQMVSSMVYVFRGTLD